MLEEGCAYPLSVVGIADIMVGYPSFALTFKPTNSFKSILTFGDPIWVGSSLIHYKLS